MLKVKSKLPYSKSLTLKSLEANWHALNKGLNLLQLDIDYINDPSTRASIDQYKNSIEYFIGSVKVPVGVVGPFALNGDYATGQYYIPLATTEAALLASYNRGIMLINEAGSLKVSLINDSISRVPSFVFDCLADSIKFKKWALANFNCFKKIAEQSSNHLKLIEQKIYLEGNHLFLELIYTTGNAAGQNMSSFATAEILDYIIKNSVVKINLALLDANFSGDKKASSASLLNHRGKSVCAEVTINKELIKKYLHTTADKLLTAWNICAMGNVLTGAIGLNGHIANGIAALYLSTGQDIAAVAESAIGITRLETTANGDIYASLSLPSLILGTVGGGTSTPTAQACLKILALKANDSAKELAEILTALCLAGELSLLGAVAAGQFAKAHKKLARDRNAKK